MKKLAVASSALLLAPLPTSADYTNNFAGRVADVLTYDSGYFLVRLDPMPSGPCNHYFIVPAEVATDARQMMLSRALTAHARGETVNVGYDDVTCVNGWYRVHRIG